MTKSETLQLRIKEIKAMHETMLHLKNKCAYFDWIVHESILHLNNEGAYFDWIVLGVPDEPREDDLESIAEDDEEFNACTKGFLEVLANYYKDGFVS